MSQVQILSPNNHKSSITLSPPLEWRGTNAFPKRWNDRLPGKAATASLRKGKDKRAIGRDVIGMTVRLLFIPNAMVSLRVEARTSRCHHPDEGPGHCPHADDRQGAPAIAATRRV